MNVPMNRSEDPSKDQANALACQRGELEQFDALYVAYVEKIYAFVYLRVFHRETAEDLTSDVFMKALEHIQSFRPDRGTFAAWLYRIARNAVIDYSRTKKIHADIEDMPALSSSTDIVKDVEARERLSKIADVLKEIRSEHRTILLLRIWDGMSYKEIAQVTGMSESNCKQIASRVLRSLRSEFGAAALCIVFLFPLWNK